MGCIVSTVTGAIANGMYFIERVTSCSVFTVVLLGMLLTIIVSGVFGIALGYHYCLTKVTIVQPDPAGFGLAGKDIAPASRRTTEASVRSLFRRSGPEADNSGRWWPRAESRKVRAVLQEHPRDASFKGIDTSNTK